MSFPSTSAKIITMKNEVIYVVVREDNQAFYAAFKTWEAAVEFTSEVRVPMEIIESVVAL